MLRNAGDPGSSHIGSRCRRVRALTSEFEAWTGRCCLYSLRVATTGHSIKPGSEPTAALLVLWCGTLLWPTGPCVGIPE